jgi:hypothetical protein
MICAIKAHRAGRHRRVAQSLPPIGKSAGLDAIAGLPAPPARKDGLSRRVPLDLVAPPGDLNTGIIANRIVTAPWKPTSRYS